MKNTVASVFIADAFPGSAGGLSRQCPHIILQFRQAFVDSFDETSVLTGQDQHQDNSDDQKQKTGKDNRLGILIELMFIPRGLKVDSDYRRHFSGGVKHRTVGTVELSPSVFVGNIIH